MKFMKAALKKVGVFISIPAVVYMLFVLMRPTVFLSWSILYSCCLQSVASCILAWGMSFSLTAGITDFSLVAQRILGAIVGILLIPKMGIWGIIVGSFAIAIILGLMKAVFNAIVNVGSMVISIAYCYIIGSIGSLIQGTNSMVLTSDLWWPGQAPAIWIIFAACGLIVFFLNRYTVFAANCRALGSNVKLALEAGINKSMTEAKCIMLAAIFSAISGIVATCYGAGTTAQTGLASMGVVFPAIIGFNLGMLLSKHVDMTFGVISGVVTMNILATGLVSLGIPSQLKDTVTGVFLLVLMCADELMRRRQAIMIRRNASLAAQAAEEQ